MEPIEGGVTMFFAFVNNTMVIGDEADTKKSWSGNISDSQVKIKVRVLGINKAKYKLVIDLPGTADDQSLTLSLEGGYHEAEILL